MGRRTTSTTKGGKFMNPTDQARKEARRRELKKNKKQRIAVRQAVIKTKDPQQMVKELEDLDDMELNPTSEFHYNEKVIKDKRRKLLETLIRIVDFYCKEDPTRGREFKSMIESYKANRAKKEMYFESVKNAQTVEITNIPLPDAPFETPHLSDIPLPGVKPQSILKKQPLGPPSGFPPTRLNEKTPPGPPPGVPPAKKVFGKGPTLDAHPNSPEPLEENMDDEDPYDPEEGPELMDKVDVKFSLPADMDDDDEEFHHRDDDDDEDKMLHDGDDSDEDINHNKKPSIRFADEDDDDDGENTEMGEENSAVTPLQAMMLKMAGQKIPRPPQNRTPHDLEEEEEEGFDKEEERARQVEEENERSRPKPPGPPPGLPPGPPPGMPPSLLQRQGILPPGPPPGRPPILPLNMGRGPDVGRMPNLPDNENRMPDRGMRMMQNPNILSAPPSLIHRPIEKEPDETQAATIVAKPKLTTNPKVDSTRFMPTSLRIRREVKGKGGKAANDSTSALSTDKQRIKTKKHGTNTADAAYDSFMKEMQGLL